MLSLAEQDITGQLALTPAVDQATINLASNSYAVFFGCFSFAAWLAPRSTLPLRRPPAGRVIINPSLKVKTINVIPVFLTTVVALFCLISNDNAEVYNFCRKSL